MIAASVPDLDGLGILVSQDAYWSYHHKLAHNLLAAVVVSGLLAAFCSQRLKAWLLFFALFHVHLLMDYWGSGPHWDIYYLWPFSNWSACSPNAWPLSSWQNITTAGLLLAWTILIAAYARRTPLELLMPSLDRKMVVGLSRRAAEVEIPADR